VASRAGGGDCGGGIRAIIAYARGSGVLAAPGAVALARAARII
jgi:hypothetical protein